MPQFAVLVHATSIAETGKMPTQQELAEMKTFNDQLRAIGALIMAEGFLSSAKGARVNFTADGPSNPEFGPFSIDNLIAGFWVWELDSLEQAIEWATKIPFKEGRVEIRRIAGKEDLEKETEDDLQ